MVRTSRRTKLRSPSPAAPPAAPPATTPRAGKRTKSKAPKTPPADYLSPLSSELLSLILHHLSPHNSPDLASVFNVALVSKNLLPHARLHLYRELRIDTRTNAHAMHRTLHANDVNKAVKSVTADVGSMAKTSSAWLGWFLFHSMHSLCGIIGSCRTLLSLTLYLPADASAWTQSLCSSLVDLKLLHTLTKDMDRSSGSSGGGAGRREGMDVGWKPRRSVAMWSVSQVSRPPSLPRDDADVPHCSSSSPSRPFDPCTHSACVVSPLTRQRSHPLAPTLAGSPKSPSSKSTLQTRTSSIFSVTRRHLQSSRSGDRRSSPSEVSRTSSRSVPTSSSCASGAAGSVPRMRVSQVLIVAATPY